MPKFSSKRRVRHSAPQMFDLVADVERYPEFVPLCKSLKIRQRTPKPDGTEIVIADMTVSFKLVREAFTSRVTLDRPNLKILVEYLQGPFSNLENRWTFEPKSDDRLRGRILHFLRIQEPDAGDADGHHVRRRVPAFCGGVREARGCGLREVGLGSSSGLATRGMTNVQNLDHLLYSIEYLVRVADDEHYSDLKVVCSVPAQRLLAQLRDGMPNARSDISSANRRTFSQVFNDPLAV